MSKRKQLTLTNYDTDNWRKLLRTQYNKVFSNDDIVQIKCHYLTYPEVKDKWTLSNSRIIITRIKVDRPRRGRVNIYNEPNVGSFVINYAQPKVVLQWYGKGIIQCPSDEDLTDTIIIEEATLSQKLLYTLAYIRGED